MTRTLIHDDREIFGIKHLDDAKPNSSFLLYPTGDHSFWVEGVGWRRVDRLSDEVPDGGTSFQLKDGSAASVWIVSPVYRTPRPHVG